MGANDPVTKWRDGFCGGQEQNEGVPTLWGLAQGLAGQVRLARLAGLGKGCRIIAAVVTAIARHCQNLGGFGSGFHHWARHISCKRAGNALERNSKADQAGNNEATQAHRRIVADCWGECQTCLTPLDATQKRCLVTGLFGGPPAQEEAPPLSPRYLEWVLLPSAGSLLAS